MYSIVTRCNGDVIMSMKRLYVLVARLHDVYGNDWVQIGHKLDRSGQSVRDKFKILPIGGFFGEALLSGRH